MAPSPTEDTEQAPLLEDPTFRLGEDPSPEPAPTELQEEDETPPEDPGPPEPPQESREAMLSRENAEYRAILTQMQGQLQQQSRQPQPQEDPNARYLQGIPADQQQAWRESFKVLHPVIQHQVQQMLEPIQNQLRQNATFTESMALAQKHQGYGAMAPQVEQARWQEYQRTGVWHPLELVYTVALGAGMLQQPQAQKQQRQTERRKQAGRAAAPTTMESQGSRVPAPRRTVEQTYAMSDEQILNLAESNGGIERLRLPTRKRA